LREVILSFCPSNALSSVDLPTLGRPISAIVPQRKGMALTAWHRLVNVSRDGRFSTADLLEGAQRCFLFGSAPIAPAPDRPKG
jgi:hypothetical protein